MNEFLTQRQAEGLSLSAAVRELAAVCGASERTVWRWLDGAAMPVWAQRLLRIWSECDQVSRRRWFV